MISRRSRVFVSVLALTMAACGGESSPTTSITSPPTTGPATQTTTPAPDTTAGLPTTTVASTTTTMPEDPAFLVVDTPLDGQFVVTETLIVRGAATPDSVVRIGQAETSTPDDPGQIYEVEGIDVSPFELSIDLVEGGNTIEVTADGVTTGQGSVTITVTYLPDATEEFAYFDRVSATEVVADYAQFLTGDEADEAAVEAGFIEPGEHVPNDYFIINENPLLRTLPVSDQVMIILPTFETGPVTEVPVEVDEWLALFDDGEPWPPNKVPADDRFFGPGAPWTSYWLTVSEGVVLQIRQQFLP